MCLRKCTTVGNVFSLVRGQGLEGSVMMFPEGLRIMDVVNSIHEIAQISHGWGIGWGCSNVLFLGACNCFATLGGKTMTPLRQLVIGSFVFYLIHPRHGRYVKC